MGKTSIKIDCVDQRLLISSGPIIASGGRNEDIVKFSFCQLWDGFEKYAVFYRSKDAVYRSAISNNQCVVPHEVLAGEGWIYIGVFGVNGDVTRTSEVLKYHVAEGAITEGTKPSDPTPDIYAQFINRVAAVEERTRAVESFTINPDAYEVNGNIVHIDNFEGMPLNCVTTIEPKQSGAGKPSPDNVRPISGWTGAKLTRCGKNLLKNTASTYTTNGIAFTVNDDGTVTVNGTSLARAQMRVGTVDLPAGSYIASAGFFCNPNNSGSAFVSYPKGGTTEFVDLSGATEKVFTLEQGATVTYQCDIRTAGITVNNLVYYPMIRPASVSDGDFKPYSSNTFTASIGQTVYGGTLNWNTGVLTVDKVLKTITGNENVIWKTNTGWIAGSWYCSTLLTGSENIAGFGTVADMICSHAPVRTPADVAYAEYCVGYGNGTNLYVNFGTAYNTETSLKKYFTAQYAAGTPVQIVYKLATPTTIQLTPHEIYALSGSNNIWCDAGKTTVSGRKDILWLTSNLLKRLNACESAIISLGGNV